MLLGRGPETTRLDTLISEAADGRGGALVIEGEPGLGKTTLLEDAAQRASRFSVLRVAGVQSTSLEDADRAHLDLIRARILFTAGGSGETVVLMAAAGDGRRSGIPEDMVHQRGLADPGRPADQQDTPG